MSRSTTSTDDGLPDLHAGADMRADLFDSRGLTVGEVAAATGLSVAAIDGFLDGDCRIDADFDLRMGRFFGFSPGYLLRLQVSYDLIAARRRSGAEIEAIAPHFDHAA